MEYFVKSRFAFLERRKLLVMMHLGGFRASCFRRKPTGCNTRKTSGKTVVRRRNVTLERNVTVGKDFMKTGGVTIIRRGTKIFYAIIVISLYFNVFLFGQSRQADGGIFEV